MAKRDFDEYYNKVANQFFSLNEAFDELAKEVAEGMVEPERQEQLSRTIEPIKNSYQMLSYVKYLLDRPTKKSKQAKYKVRNKKLLVASEGKQSEDILATNRRILDKVCN